MSKFSPAEFPAYANRFFGKKKDDIKKGRDKSGYYRPYMTGDDRFDEAWFHHQKKNPHHWQYWLMPKDRDDEGGFVLMPMPEKYVREMVCDWRGAGRAICGKDEAVQFYRNNRERMLIHPDSERLVQKYLGILED